MQRRFPIGAEAVGGGAHFRVWAPEREHVEVLLADEGGIAFALAAETSGYFSAFIEQARIGSRYTYRLDGDGAFPDPASRFQPEGVHGPSEIVDSSRFPWKDANWPGIAIDDQVIYELHIGTFTREGTWTSAMEELARLAELGITVLEVMPVGEFAGRYGWGYDGVYWFAPAHVYGTPDDFRRFVDHAHSLSLGVILDVVYNHLGPEGNYLSKFSPYYVSQSKTDWGDAINFDGQKCGPVREFVTSNAGYWIEEFHLDGLRLDATHQIFDTSSEHILAAIGREARRKAGSRKIIVVAEHEHEDTRLIRPLEQGGFGLDAMWNDDFHHSARVALTGNNEGYYSDFRGSPQELISATKYGFLYQGQRSQWMKRPRGRSGKGLPPASSVIFLENHDQVSNSADGSRLRTLTSPGCYRAMITLLLLAPGTPLLFQGQEFGASSPFPFFADHPTELARLVREGRTRFLSQFAGVAQMRERVPDPGDSATFERAKLDPGERECNQAMLALHRDLLELRRTDPAFRSARARNVDGAVLSSEAFVLRFFLGDRLLFVNLGTDLILPSAAEPLIAPPDGGAWRILWSSEDPKYGGLGTPELETKSGWKIPAQCAALLGSK